jgi:glycosyltransferase involved in cell wall biosynthesis
MMSSIQNSKILFISTFPPKKCGIASFTQDLVNAINPVLAKDIFIDVCALDKKKNGAYYDVPVSMIMDSHQMDSCMETAQKINRDSSIRLICIEHEFGLYGGELGEYLLGFLSLIEKPFIIRLHTVLPNPSEKMLKIVKSIGLLADKVIVMTKNSARLLTEVYQVSPDKIMIIPHGTHAISKTGVNELKIKYNLENKQVLTTFGLLSPNKGIEKGIIAMKEISASVPEAVYIVLGQTHPNLLEQDGEKYREFLQELIDDHGLQDNVILINEYVPTNMLMEYLALTDIYLFTSKDPNQAVSGTFLYAMSAGCPVISNSFVLAKEMLDEKTGIILKTSQDQELAEEAINILHDPQLREEMSKNAFLKMRNSTWEKVAQKHASLFCNILGIPSITSKLSNEYIK